MHHSLSSFVQAFLYTSKGEGNMNTTMQPCFRVRCRKLPASGIRAYTIIRIVVPVPIPGRCRCNYRKNSDPGRSLTPVIDFPHQHRGDRRWPDSINTLCKSCCLHFWCLSLGIPFLIGCLTDPSVVACRAFPCALRHLRVLSWPMVSESVLLPRPPGCDRRRRYDAARRPWWWSAPSPVLRRYW